MEAFRIGEEVIERVDDFLYLGSKIGENGGTILDVQQRVNKARGAFSRLKNVWRANSINLHFKIKLFNACVKSVLLYGCEIWFVTENVTRKLQTFVNRCLRNILGIKWPQIISNDELWEKTGQSKIDVEIMRRIYAH